MIAFGLQQMSFGSEFCFDDVFDQIQVSMCDNMSAAACVAQWIRRLPPKNEIVGLSLASNTYSFVTTCCEGKPASVFGP